MKTLKRGHEGKTLIMKAEGGDEEVMRKQILSLVDFPVEKRNLTIKDTKISVGSHYALYRKDSGMPIGVVSKAYQLVPHTEILAPLLEKLEIGKWKFRSVRVENFGSRVWVEAFSLKDGFSVGKVNGKDDVIHPRLLLANSYDGSLALKFHLGAYRLLCSNGMAAPAEEFKGINMDFSHKHIGRSVSDFLKNFNKNIDSFNDNMGTMAKTYRSLVNMTVSKAEAEKVFAESVGTKRVRILMDLFGGGDNTTNQEPTAWNVYNAVTRWVTREFNGGIMVGEEKNQKALNALLSLRK